MTRENETLKIVLVQPDIAWQDIPKNLNNFDVVLNKIEQPVDLILFPEMFATGFLPNPKDIPDEEYERIQEWMLKMANHLNSCIAGSNPCKYEGKYYNRFIAAFPDGSVKRYDKRHLFTMGGERQHFHPGRERMIFEVKGWKIMPLICYDLRFPVWSRNDLNYDLLVYSVNWPKARNHVWDILMMARAIENQCYIAGINRIGIDGQAIEYNGQSQVISPKGEVMVKLGNYEDIITISLNREELHQFRKEFPVRDDADDFTIV